MTPTLNQMKDKVTHVSLGPKKLQKGAFLSNTLLLRK